MVKFPIAVVSEQRRRDMMEDAHCVARDFSGVNGWLFVGVFDGHGSYRVAEGLAGNMAYFMGKKIVAGKTPREAHRLAYAEAAKADWAQLQIEGSCAATFLVQGKTLTCANAGDCRIIVVGKSARQLTRDHNARNKTEAKRIAKHGAKIDSNGYVESGDKLLNITRAIGDVRFNNAGVIPVPYVRSYILQPDDRFIVAASDGLFGKTSNKRVFVLSRQAQSAEELAQILKQEVEQRDGSDNLTVIVVQLR